MAVETQRVLDVYARVLVYGGTAALVVALGLDQRWVTQPLLTLSLTAAVIVLRSAPVRLSKYSYLTQSAVPALVGTIIAGPGQVVFALAVGTVVADGLWLRKSMRAAVINAGREVLAFLLAFLAYAVVMRLTGSPGLSLDFLPAAFTLVGGYFFASRGLFYLTLLIRDKLESEERLLILRYEIVSYLLTIGAVVLVIAALHTLTTAGWVSVLLVLGVLGLLTKRILEEAIAAEDLNKAHLIGAAAASHASLDDAFSEIERLAHRLLDWGDLRIYRLGENGPVLSYRGKLGRAGRDSAPDLVRGLRAEVLDTGEPVLVHDVSRDARFTTVPLNVQCVMLLPLQLADKTVGTLELEHHNRHAYRHRDLAAGTTLAGQISTAIHIAELRRPLLETVDQIGVQVRTLARLTESVGASAAALAAASRAMQAGAVEQDAFVSAGLEATSTLSKTSKEVAAEGVKAAATSQTAAEVAARNRAIIGDAIQRLVHLQDYVADSSRQVEDLGSVSRRLTGFIGSIREIADLTNLISLNAAIEAARAGQHGRGFGVVAEGVRQLAAQSTDAAREASRLIADISTKVQEISALIRRGEDVVAGVEALSADAARALESIVATTQEAGRHARRIAETAVAQESSFNRLNVQIEKVATGSARTRNQTNALAEQATEATQSQAELESTIKELAEVATRLQTITRHFSARV